MNGTASDAVKDAALHLIGDVVTRGSVDALAGIELKWFHDERVARIARIALELHDEGRHVDALSVGAAYEHKHESSVLSWLAGVTGNAIYSPAQQKEYAEILRRDWMRRESSRVGHAIQHHAHDQAQVATLSELLGSIGSRPAEQSLLAQAVKADALMHVKLADVDCLLGHNLLIRGGLSLLVGHSGLGKTYLALQLMRSLCEGSEWLGFSVPSTLRVGLLELEMPLSSIRDRMRPIRGEWQQRASILCMPATPVDLLERDCQQQLIAWATEHRLQVLVMDPLNQLHGLDENKAGDVARVMRAVHRIRMATGIHILLLHHATKTDTKQQADANHATPRTLVLQMVRGSGRLGNDPDTVMGLLEAPGGRVRLVFAKTRHGMTPNDVYLKRDVNGYLEQTEGLPQTEAANNNARAVEKYVLVHEGCSVAEIATGLRMSRPTVRRHLDALSSLREERGRIFYVNADGEEVRPEIQSAREPAREPEAGPTARERDMAEDYAGW